MCLYHVTARTSNEETSSTHEASHSQLYYGQITQVVVMYTDGMYS